MSNLSPAPGAPQTPHKAYAASGIVAVGVFLAFWLLDDGKHFTKDDLQEALTAALVLSGLAGGGTFAVKNKPKRG